jgi:acyl dehydratase
VALDQSFVGRSYPPTELYVVGREKIREYVDAIGETERAYRDPAAAVARGYPDVIAPPTFPIVLSHLSTQPVLDDPKLGLDFSRVVHGDQRFSYTRPIQAGDRLICVCTVEEILSRGGLDFLTLRTDVSTEAGEHVVTVTGRLVARGEGDRS